MRITMFQLSGFYTDYLEPQIRRPSEPAQGAENFQENQRVQADNYGDMAFFCPELIV